MTERFVELDVDWTASYEDLRAVALGGSCAGTLAKDVTVLLKQGLASWLVAKPGPALFPPATATGAEVRTGIMEDDLRKETAMVLASMALLSGRGAGA